MHRYGTLEFKNISFKTLIKIINKADEQKTREELYQMYLSILPHYDKKNFKTFKEFYEKFKPRTKVKQDSRSDEEVLDEYLKKRS